MRYEIGGGMMPAVTLFLNSGEGIYTESGGMCWMTEGFDMEVSTNAGGPEKGAAASLLKSAGRVLGGESLFLTTYTATRDTAQITISSGVPGEIKVFEIAPGREYIAQKGAFLCAQKSVQLGTVVNKNPVSGLFGGEGFIMQKFSGSGLVFCEIDGGIYEYTLAPGESMIVNTGNIAVFESTVSYSVERVKHAKNVLFGGEGLFSTKLTGPGKIWLQTMNLGELAVKLLPFVTKKK